MMPTLEVLDPGAEASFRCRTFDLDHFPFVWHVHPEHELTLIVEGEGRRFVGDHVDSFRAGEVVLLGSNLPHTWFSRAAPRRRSRSVVIQFLDDCFGPAFFDLPELRPLRRLLRRAEAGLVFHGKARREAAARMTAMSAMTGPARVAALLATLDLLARSRGGQRLSDRAHALPLRDRDRKRIDRVLGHINEHYTEPLEQPVVAELAEMTPAAFSRFFKRMTGRTFVAYVQRLRVSRACRLLTETDAPITDVCYDAGFGNLSNFNRVFQRERGMNPRKFRETMA